jgi:DNA-binding MarR family transcriptional regulator
MRALASIDEGDTRISGSRTELAMLVSRVRLAIVSGLDEELLKDEELAALDVTAAQFVILKNVLKGSARSACELCKALDYDRGAMSRMIDRMESKRLIQRVELSHTRRSVALEVTDAGKAAFPKMEACLDRVVDRLSKGITQSEVREVEKVLRRMLANT